jgi:hypothetical protein
MFTHIRISCVDSAATRIPDPKVRVGCLMVTALALVGCGGGNSAGTGLELTPPAASATATPPPPAPAPAPKALGSVIVSTVTTSGTPISGLSVALNGGFDGRTATTDHNGEATFKNLPAGDASTNLGGGRLPLG